LTLLGPPRVAVDGGVVVVDTRKAIAMLAYLAVDGPVAARPTLAGLLWPEYDDEHARGALRRTLSTLRAGLGGRWVSVNGDLIGLDQPAVEVDILRVRAGIRAARTHDHPSLAGCRRCRTRLVDVLDLHRGEFMAGFGLRDSPEWDDWQAERANEVRRELAWLLESLADAEIASGDLVSAVAHAARWLALDPLHEAAHRALMRIRSLRGDRSGAIRQYRDCVAVLDRELGVEPLPETTNLYREIAAGTAHVSAPPAQPTAATDVRPGPLAFVGREMELARLLASWREAQREGGVALVEGEPGIGKTRLVSELAARVRDGGGAVLELRTYPDEEGLPYASIAGALKALAEGDHAWARALPDHVLADASRLAPGLTVLRPSPASSPLEGPGAEVRFVDSVTRLMIASVSRADAPGLVTVDDLQWADRATRELLAYLMRRIGRERVSLVLSRRIHDPLDDPLARLLDHLDRERRLVRMPLARFDREALSALATSALGPLPDGLVDRLAAASEGVPFHATEYLAALAAGSDPEATTAGLRSLVLGRFAGIGPGTRQVLAAAAIVGRDFDVELLRSVSGRADDEVVDALEELRARGLIVDEGGMYGFDHHTTLELAHGEVTDVRRRLLHRRAAAAIERTGRHPASATIAAHLRAAGDGAAAIWYARAADEAAALYANAEALAHYRSALALGGEPAALQAPIGDMEQLMGGYDAALAAYEAAAAVATGTELASLEQRIAAVHARRGEWPLAVAHLEAALETRITRNPAIRSALLVDLALAALRLGEAERSERLSAEALKLANAQSGDARARAIARARNLRGMLARARRDLGAARHELEAGLGAVTAAATATGGVEVRMALLNNLAFVTRQEGHLERAVDVAKEALSIAVTVGDRHHEAALRNNLADALNAAGRRDDARAEVGRSAAIFAEVGRTDAWEPEIWKLVDW